MDVVRDLPAELVFAGMGIQASEDVPADMVMLVTPKFDRFGHLDYAATVESSVLVQNVGQA